MITWILLAVLILALIRMYYIIVVINHVTNEMQEKSEDEEGEGTEYLNELEQDFIAKVREKSSF